MDDPKQIQRERFLVDYNDCSGSEKKFKLIRDIDVKQNASILREFEELEEGNFFEKGEQRFIIKWTKPKDQNNENEKSEEELQKDVIEGFDKYSRDFEFITTKRTILKYLLYKSGYNKKQKYISEYLEQALKEDHSFILKIIELKNSSIIESNPDALKDRDIIREIEQLVFKVFTDNDFNKTNSRTEEGIVNLDKKNIFLKFLSILVGELKQNSEFQAVPTFLKNDNINQEKFLSTIVKQYKNLPEKPSNFGIELYLFFLENKINFGQHIKNNLTEEEKSQITKDYLKIAKRESHSNNISPIESKIIDDLCSYYFFKKSKITPKIYLRIPLHKVIEVYYNDQSVKNVCLNYFDSLKKNYITKENKENEFTKECSLLNPRLYILHCHYNEKLFNYFKIEKDSIVFNVSVEKIEELTKTWSDGDSKQKYKNIIKKLVESEMNSSLRRMMQNIEDNDSLLKILEKETKQNFENIMQSLQNKNIFEFNEKVIEKTIEDDIFKRRTLFEFIAQKDLTFTDMIHSIIINKKTFPKFINEIKINNNLKLELIIKREEFLNNNYMKNVILELLEEHKNTNEKQSNEEMLINLHSFFKNNILKLYSLFNIYEYAKILVGSDLNDIGSNVKESYLIPINDNNTNENKNSILIKEFVRLVARVKKHNSLFELMKTIYADPKWMNNFIKMFEYCNEFSSQCGFVTNHLLELEICYLCKCVFKDNIFNKEGSKDFLEKFQKNEFESNLLNDITNFDTSKDKKFFSQFARIIFYKYIKENTNNINYTNNTNEVFNIITKFDNIFEGISLIQQIIDENIKLIGEKNILLKLTYDNVNKINPDIESNFLDDKLKHLISLQKILNVKLKNEKSEWYWKQKRIILIHCFEKLLLKLITKKNIRIFKEAWFEKLFEKSMNLIEDYNNKLIDDKPEDKTISLEHYFAISFLKLFAHVYIEVFYDNENTSYCSFENDYISNNQDNISVKILQFYILKIIRNNYCDSFRTFRNFNFTSYQLIWVSELKFKGEFNSEFEYLFFSNWNIYDEAKRSEQDGFNYFKEYSELKTKYLSPLRKDSFRTSKYDDNIKQIIKKQPDIYIDLIMNEILCFTISNEYIGKMEYVEFSSWSKHLLMSITEINEKIKDFLILLSIYNDNKGYKQILDLLKDSNNQIILFDLEVIFIALKFELAIILGKVNLKNTTDNEEKKQKNPIQYQLIKQLEEFIIESDVFYQNMTMDQSQKLINKFKKIQESLRINNINQIKLFCNFCYYLIKTQSKQTLFPIIENAIQKWPYQTPFIEQYYEFTLYKKEKIRNLILDERLESIALIDNICGKDNNALKIPVYTYFYFENLPTWDNFISFFNQLDKPSQNEYPYINFFKKPENYNLYQESLKSDKISQFPSMKGCNIYNFKYSRFKSLDDLSSFYSKSYIFYKECNIHLAYKIDYDIDSIERELSSIKYANITNSFNIQNK